MKLKKAVKRLEAWPHAYLVRGTSDVHEARRVLRPVLGPDAQWVGRGGWRPCRVDGVACVAFYFEMCGNDGPF